MMDTTHFFLATDKHAALAMRRRLAEGGGGLGVAAGTWPELMSLLRDSCLIVPSVTDWRDTAAEAADRVSNAFWKESFATAPDETVDALLSALTALLTAAGPEEKTVPEIAGCPARLEGIMGDLRRLHRETRQSMPGPIQEIRCLLDAGEDDWIRRVAVHRIPGRPLLDPWQTALVDHINDLSGPSDEVPHDLLAAPDASLAPSAAKSALTLIQGNLFSKETDKGTLDGSVQWIGVRDALEEIEVAAQMICRMLAEDNALIADDVALLLPADPSYAPQVESVFGRFGIPLAGLEIQNTRRNLGQEVVHLFLRCQRKPAPAVALAALFSSSLAPWTEAEGRSLAAFALSSRIPSEGKDKPERWPEIRRLIRTAPKDAKALRGRLARFLSIIEETDAAEGDIADMRAAAGGAIKFLKGSGAIPWHELERRTCPGGVIDLGAGPANRGCHPVFYERREPWRPVRHLLVLGFTDGHYPEPPPGIPVLSAEDIRLLTEAGLPMASGTHVQAFHRERFARQLSAVTDSLSFLVPRFDPGGAPVAASASLGYMARLFMDGEELEPEGLIRWLDNADDPRSLRWYQAPTPGKPCPPRQISSPDLELGRDLLSLRIIDGAPAPESPSGLEKLLISPLAWLLHRSGLGAADWTPPGINPAIEGSLAHRVFEKLFPRGSGLPTIAEIHARVPELLREAVLAKAPHLDAQEYQLELSELDGQIIEAAEAWRDILANRDAKVAAVELELHGEFHGAAIRGWTDVILEVDEGLLVVDYKKSGSKGRWARMEKGCDTQASLYTRMLKHGEPPQKTPDLHEKLAAGTDIGFLYYTMNDQTVLAGTPGGPKMTGEGIRNAEGDVASAGLQRIRDALEAIRTGRIRLGRKSEIAGFKKETGINAEYTMQDSPLLELFQIEDEEVES